MKSAWVSVGAYMALIFIVSGTSFRSPLFEDAQKIHVDWLVHVVEYGFLGFLLARALQKSGMPACRQAGGPVNIMFFAAVLAIGVAYAASDEYHQSFVPSRDASVHDGVADTVGLTLGAWLWMRRQKKSGKINA